MGVREGVEERSPKSERRDEVELGSTKRRDDDLMGNRIVRELDATVGRCTTPFDLCKMNKMLPVTTRRRRRSWRGIVYDRESVREGQKKPTLEVDWRRWRKGGPAVAAEVVVRCAEMKK